MELIVAANADWGIGLGGSQAFVFPEDRQRFRELTAGGVLVVGRRTLADFPCGAPLPGRQNIILTRDRSFKAGGAVTAGSLYELARALRGYPPERIYVVGGGAVYELLLPYCSRAHVTRIHETAESDTFFPNLDMTPGWKMVERGPEKSHGSITYTFDIYENTAPADIMEAQNV